MPSIAALVVFSICMTVALLFARWLWANHLVNRHRDIRAAIENARCVRIDIDDLIGKGALHG